jgi:hypothetical protein
VLSSAGKGIGGMGGAGLARIAVGDKGKGGSMNEANGLSSMGQGDGMEVSTPGNGIQLEEYVPDDRIAGGCQLDCSRKLMTA